MQRIFINKCFLFTVGSVCRVKRFTTEWKTFRWWRRDSNGDAEVAQTTVKRLLCCGFLRTGKAMWQVYQCWWRICREINIFNVETIIIRGCKWNEAVSNRKCNNLFVSYGNYNNLWLLIPSLLSNRSSIVDLVTLEMFSAKCKNLWLLVPSLLSNWRSVNFVTLEIFSAKHVNGFGYIASETRWQMRFSQKCSPFWSVAYGLGVMTICL
jgi:hypothetical protein